MTKDEKAISAVDATVETPSARKERRPLGGPLIISSGDEKDFFNFIYKSITHKTESIGKATRANKITTRSDIKSLCDRLSQVAQANRCSSESLQISVDLVDDKNYRFNNIDSFMNSDITIPSNTDSITIEYSFFVINQTSKNSEYKILIHIESVDFLVRQDEHRVLNEIMRPPAFFATVHFDEYLIAKYVMTVIDDWIKGLDDIKVSPTFEWIRRRYPPYSMTMMPKRIVFLISAVPPIIMMWLTLRSLNSGLDQAFIDYVMFYAILITLSTKLSEIAHSICASNIISYRSPTFYCTIKPMRRILRGTNKATCVA